MSAALSVENLSLAIGGKTILSDVSLAVQKGEVVALVGESGSGKSLTLLSAMRLLPPDARARGEVRLGDDLLTGLSEREMCAVRGARMGMVFQEPMTALNPVQSVGAQIAEAVARHRAAPRAEAMAAARTSLDRVGLGAIGVERFPHELSGGQRQRVAIAIASVLKPSVLLADEPTTALDVTTQAGVLDLFRALVRDDGAALVLVTHDLGLAANFADRIVIMQAGRIVESGETRLLLRNLQTPYGRALLAAATLPPRPPRTRDANAPNVVEAKCLSVAYHAHGKSFRALDDVSLSVRKGECLGIVGESGSGKSTLARSILGFETPVSGEVRIGGDRWRGAARAQERAMRRRVQIVFQDPYSSFDPRHRVGRIVAEPLHLLGGRHDEAKVGAVLESVGLAAADASKYPHQFSGGQRQRIALARALITDPDVIVLDEAVSALDVTIRAQILDLLRALQERLGMAYLFITHDLGVLRAIADRVIVLKDGRIVEEGAVADVLDAPKHPYTAALAAAHLEAPV